MIFVAASVDFWRDHKRCAWCGGAMRRELRWSTCSLSCTNITRKVRELIVRAGIDLAAMMLKAGALSPDWDLSQWRVEAEIIADRLLSGEEYP